MTANVQIEFNQIPGCELEQICRTLKASIERELADPVLRQRYDAFAEEYERERAGHAN